MEVEQDSTMRRMENDGSWTRREEGDAWRWYKIDKLEGVEREGMREC